MFPQSGSHIGGQLDRARDIRGQLCHCRRRHDCAKRAFYAKSPKPYFADAGLLCHLLGITKHAFADSPFNGAVRECYVFSELRKLLAKQAQHQTLFFYRDKQQLEVDFLLMGGNQARLLECKWSEFPDAHNSKNLGRLTEIFLQNPMPETRHVESFVVCQTPNAFPIGKAVKAVNLLKLDSVVG
jgi:predicted AAA+ superfamily ATPase